METIQNYLDNLFASLPKTKEILHIKQDLFISMEEKYHELKDSGKSENEAIGIVISEFGNIDELIEEMGIKIEDQPHIPTLSKEETEGFLSTKRKSGKWVGLGVFLCILAPAILILMFSLTENNILPNIAETVGLIILFLLIASAIGLFIYADNRIAPYKHLEKKNFQLSNQLRAEIQQQKKNFLSTFTISLILGVGLLILSPLTVIIANAIGGSLVTYGVVVLLILVAMAIFILIYSGTIKESFDILLQEEEFSEEKRKINRVIGAVATVVWPLAVCIFLVSGLVFHKWHINWIVFPITGILFGMFCGVYNILKDNTSR